MRSLLRCFTSLLLALVAAVPLLCGGCHARVDVYDPYYHDSHVWATEEPYYTQWEHDTHREHMEFNKRSDAEKKEYWDYRHNQHSTGFRFQVSGVSWAAACFALLAARARTPALQPVRRPAVHDLICALNDEGGDAVDDGVSALACGANEARIFQAQASMTGGAGQVGDCRCVECGWVRGLSGHGMGRFRFQVTGFR